MATIGGLSPVRVLPYKGLMGTCGKPGYVFRDFCLKQGIDFIIFCLNRGIGFINVCLKWGIFQNSFVIANGLNKKEFWYLLLSYTGYGFGLNVLNRVGKSVIFILNRVRVWGAGPHLPTQGYIKYPPPPHPGGIEKLTFQKQALHLTLTTN